MNRTKYQSVISFCLIAVAAIGVNSRDVHADELIPKSLFEGAHTKGGSLHSEGAIDCNSNGVPDDADISSGNSGDCNDNGKPDECDIANGESNDCQGDGVPDECGILPPLKLEEIAMLPGAVYIGAPRNDFDRLFVVQRGGRIRIIRNGALLPTPFLDISMLVGNGSEKGMLGLAFHPNYAANGHFFVNYTDNVGSLTHVTRYTALNGDPLSDLADPASAVELRIYGNDSPIHRAGGLQFGPDGMLYVPTGDTNISATAQDPNTLSGKILRLDVDNPPGFIPADNPFVGPDPPLDEIWAFGLRNPWRFSFDRSTGDLFIGDVGANTYEEVNFLPAGSTGGANFGWPCSQGLNCSCQCDSTTFAILSLFHTDTPHSAIIGGYVYRGCGIPELTGTYVYGDYGGDFIRGFRLLNGTPTVSADLTKASLEFPCTVEPQFTDLVSFGEDASGELYAVTLGGRIFKIVPTVASTSACGDGVLEQNEECDPPSGSTCDESCRLLMDCLAPAFVDNFESDQGWIVGASGDNATTGIWEIVDPVGTLYQPDDDHTASGTRCFVTQQNMEDTSPSMNDVSGITTVTSPTFSLPYGGLISVWVWVGTDSYSNSPIFRTYLSNNGSTWNPLPSITGNSPNTCGGWHHYQFDVVTYVEPTNNMKVRFQARRGSEFGTIYEAAFDDLRITPYDCNSNCIADGLDIIQGTSIDLEDDNVPDECQCPHSQGDFNGDSRADLLDFQSFQQCVGQISGLMCPCADMDSNRVVNATDIHLFIDVLTGP